MTIKEIAEMAGVSSAAVSRYLNGGYISDEKRERIRRVIKETGYVPSSQARALRTKRARLVGVVVPKISSESIARITAGIGQVLSSRGYQMLLADTGNDPKKEIEYLDLFDAYPVDGIILAGTVISKQHRSFFNRSHVPIVVIGQRVEEVSSVFHDDYGAAKELGASIARSLPSGARAAYIGVTRDDVAAGAAREDGMLAGLRMGGCRVDERDVIHGDFTSDSGRSHALSLINSGKGLDLIACATDSIAAGVMGAVQQAQRAGTLQFSSPVVSGFGDNRVISAITGGIPTVHFAYLTSGLKGAEILLEAIEGKSQVPVQMQLGFEVCMPTRSFR